MYSRWELATKFLRYYATASNGKGHGIHSPFVFEFVTRVLNDQRTFYAYQHVESLRDHMRIDRRMVHVQDMGAGSASSSGSERTVSEILRHAAKPSKWGKLLFRVCNFYQPQSILELGTSLGISTSYLALGNKNARCYTVEGASAIADIAKSNFKRLGLANIRSLTGNFDAVLPEVLNNIHAIDLAFIDGNHRKEPTLRYFQQLVDKKSEEAVFIFDDIHWSREMEEAWQLIKADSRVLLTIDLFFMGFVFFSNQFKVRQNFTIRF